MDLLSILLNEVRAEGAVFGRNLLAPPWTLEFADPAALTIAIMLRGSGAAQLTEHVSLASRSTQPAPTYSLDAGDIAIFTRGRTFRLTDGSENPAPPRCIVREDGSYVTATGEPIPQEWLDARTCGGATDAPTVIVTGTYHVDSHVARRVTTALPPLVVLPRSDEACPVLDLTTAEIERSLPGQQAVLNRLLDLLLISTLRSWFDSHESAAPGWYAALSDPALREVLRLIHDEPGRGWSLNELAAQAGVSRASLARRFAEVVGETPMAYLTRLRLLTAADLLRTTDLTVDAVARRVGYQSGFGLSVAMKRVLGERPSDLRVAG